MTVIRHDVAEPAVGEVLIRREFGASRGLVFDAWSDPVHLAAWFAPRGCTLDIRAFDFREGGRFHTCIRNPAFGECWCVGTYLEIARPERIVFTMATADKDGKIVEPAAAGHDVQWPRETTVTVTFAEQQGKTLLALHQTVSETLARKTGAYPSWLEMLDRLAEALGASRNG